MATLTAADNDKTVIVGGSTAGSLTVDGTVADGFACRVRNRTGAPLAVTGIALVGGLPSIPGAADAVVTAAGSAVEAAVIDPGLDLAAAAAATAVSAADLLPLVQGGALKSVSAKLLAGDRAVTFPLNADSPLTTTPMPFFIPDGFKLASVLAMADAPIAGGSFSLTASIGATAVTGISAVAVSAGGFTATASANNTVSAGGRMGFLAASGITGTPTGVLVAILQRV